MSMIEQARAGSRVVSGFIRRQPRIGAGSALSQTLQATAVPANPCPYRPTFASIEYELQQLRASLDTLAAPGLAVDDVSGAEDVNEALARIAQAGAALVRSDAYRRLLLEDETYELLPGDIGSPRLI